MVIYCFAPDCDHHSESHTCKFYGFPHKIKKKEEYECWIRLIRKGSFMVCRRSCVIN